MSIRILDVPSVIENTLTLLEVETIEDLLRLDLELVKQRRGVGARKVDVLHTLLDQTRAMMDGSEPPTQEKTYLLDELIAAHIDPDMHWNQVLTKIDQRSRTVFNREGYVTLRDIIMRLESGALMELQGFGEQSRQKLVEALDLLVELGPERFMWGKKGRPQTLSEAVERAKGDLEPVDRHLLSMRLEHHSTLESAARTLDISREGARQRIARSLNLLSQRWSVVFTELTQVLMERAALQGRWIALPFALELVGLQHAHDLILVFETLGQPSTVVDGHLCLMTEPETQQFFDAMTVFVEGIQSIIVSNEQLDQFARKLGVFLPKAQLVHLLAGYWEAMSTDEGLLHPRQDYATRYALILKEHGVPAKIEEISELIAQVYQSHDLPSYRHVYLYLQRAPEIFYVGRGLYTHESCLGLPKHDLMQAARWASAELMLKIHAVSTSVFIPDLLRLGLLPEGISPLLLRDAMSRLPEIITFESTDLVAHQASFKGERLTQAAHVERILSDAQEPLTFDEIRDLYPSHLSHSKGGLYATLSQSSSVLNIGQGRFMHQDAVGLTPQAFDKIIEHALPKLTTEPQPVARVLSEVGSPQAAYLMAHPYGSRILWALLKQREDVEAHANIEVSLPRFESQTLLEQAVLDTLEHHRLLTRGQLEEAITLEHELVLDSVNLDRTLKHLIAHDVVSVLLDQWFGLTHERDSLHPLWEVLETKVNMYSPTFWQTLTPEGVEEFDAFLQGHRNASFHKRFLAWRLDPQST